MSITVDDSASQWVYSRYGIVQANMTEAGWHQLADDPSAVVSDYYNRTDTWTATPGAAASLVFQGTAVLLYAAISPDGGHMAVALDDKNTSVFLNHTESQAGWIVYNASGLDPGVLHALTVQMVDGGRINIDQIGVTPLPPSAIPPVMPSPLPPAFPNTTKPENSVIVSTVTQTMTMTASASALPASTSPLDKEVLAGAIAAGALATIFLATICIFIRRRARRRRHSSLADPALPSQSRLRKFNLGFGRRHSRQSFVSNEPSFIQIKDEEMAENFEGKPRPGSGRGGWLPSIKHVSTINLYDHFSNSTPPSPSPSRAILSQFPIPPSHRSVTPGYDAHSRNRSIALSLSINTEVASVQASRDADHHSNYYCYPNVMRTSKVGSLSRRDARRQVRGHGRTLSGFSSLDICDALPEVDPDAEAEQGRDRDRDEKSSMEFYTAHFRAGSQSERHYSSGKHEKMEDDIDNEGDGDGDADDDGVRTPLIPNSPAVASSNASLSFSLLHDGSAHSDGPRVGSNRARGDKILRSRSSRRSSVRYSLGKHSSSGRSSTGGTARTPVSASTGAGTGDSPQSSARSRTLSFPGAGAASPLSPPPAPPPNGDGGSTAALEGSPSRSGAPSAWASAAGLTASSRRLVARLARAHGPAYGPRVSSVGGDGSAADAAAAPLVGDTEALSVVEEAPGTDRGSLDTRSSAS